MKDAEMTCKTSFDWELIFHVPRTFLKNNSYIHIYIHILVR